MHFDSRQSAYYRKAAEILGFLNPRKAYSLTELGRQLFFSDTPTRIKIVVCALLRNPIVGCVVACLEAGTSQRISLQDIEDLIRSMTKQGSVTTVQRRARTIMAWLKWLARNHWLIAASGDGIRLKAIHQ